MTRPLSDFVSVRSRFHRSVHLVRDAATPPDQAGYVVTPTARELAQRVWEGAFSEHGIRAWSITGPYGTGKSAFALFLARLLSEADHDDPELQRSRVEVVGTHEPRARLLPVALVGERSTLEPALLEALHRALAPLDPKLARRIASSLRSRSISPRDVVNQFEAATASAALAGYSGLMLIVDEFGKFLEHSARASGDQDLYVMQLLAEMAARSAPPFVLMTLLHSAFADYLGTVDQACRTEWQKVQGRFTDATFLEPVAEQLRLLGAAIEHRWDPTVEVRYITAVARTVRSEALAEARRRMPEVEQHLVRCAPLEPLVALVLGPLSRGQLAQHERTVFAFLSSPEPFALKEFLDTTAIDESQPAFYRLPLLYDYITSSLGGARYQDDKARYWAEIAGALDRLDSDAPPMCRDVIKAVGLLSLFGAPVGVWPTDEIISLALRGRTRSKSVHQAIEHLSARSILVFRRHQNAYGLWQGSDVDLMSRLEVAFDHVYKSGLASHLRRLIDARPFVARAHYFDTGTLRYLPAHIIDGDQGQIEAHLARDLDHGDGTVTFVLTESVADRRDLMAGLAANSAALAVRGLCVLAFPRPVTGLEELVRNVAAWEWVRTKTPELAGDPIARREVEERLAGAREDLERIVGPALGLRGHRFEPGLSEWMLHGDCPTKIKDARAFNEWLSACCDNVFAMAPNLHNELLNREKLSSAAAAARRSLIEAMLMKEGTDRLGIEGNPPESSMFEALLREGGFYRRTKNVLRFSAPTNRTWKDVWNAIDQFLKSTRSGRKPIAELFTKLRSPPYGLREGPIPVVLLCAVLANRENVALYEEGAFVADLRIEVWERLLRAPQDYEIQLLSLPAPRAQELARLARALPDGAESVRGDKRDLIGVVRRLVLFATRLPRFTRNTKSLSPAARALLGALLQARDPFALLFEDLPAALGVGTGSAESALKSALEELSSTYPRLLDRIERAFRVSFALPAKSADALAHLVEVSTPIANAVPSGKIAVFARATLAVGDRDWRVALASAVHKGLPPDQWSDRDFREFEFALGALRTDLARAQELVAEQGHTRASQVLRVGILDGQLREVRETISITDDIRDQAKELAAEIRRAIDRVPRPQNGRAGTPNRTVMAALARVVFDVLQESQVGQQQE